MKTKFWLGMMLLACSLVSFTGCSSSKNSNKGYAQQMKDFGEEEVEIKMPEAVQMAEAKPALRAWGEGTAVTTSLARNLAENQARAQWSRFIETKVTASTKEAYSIYNKYASDSQSTESVQDTDKKASDIANSVSTNLVNKTAVIKTNTFKTKNGQYHCYVCVEYQEGETALMRDINNTLSNVINPVKSKLSGAQRKQIDDEMAELEKQLEKDLMNY